MTTLGDMYLIFSASSEIDITEPIVESVQISVPASGSTYLTVELMWKSQRRVNELCKDWRTSAQESPPYICIIRTPNAGVIENVQYGHYI